MARSTEYLVIRQIATNELRICRVCVGYRPSPDAIDAKEYTWGGPYPSAAAARRAVESKCETLRQQLYPAQPAVTP